MPAELGTWAGAIGAAIHGAESAAPARRRGSGRLVPWRPPQSAAGSSSTTASRSGELDGRGRADRRGRARRAAPTTTRCRTSRRASSTSTSTAGAATTRWAAARRSTGWPAALLRQGVTSFLPTAVTAPLVDAGRVRRPRPRVATDGARRRRGAARLQPRGPVPRRLEARRPRRRAPAAPADVDAARLEPLLDGLRVDDDRPGAAGRARPDPAGWRRAASSCRWATPRRPSARPRAGYDGGRPIDDPPVQRDDRRRPPLAGPRGRGAPRGRRLRRADRRRPPRRPGALAADPPPEATGPAAARQRRPPDRRHEREPGHDRRARGRGPRRPGDARRDVDARRVAWSRSTRASATSSCPASHSRTPSPRRARAPLALLGVDDRGRIAAGQRADLVELDDGFRVRRVMRAGRWFG